MSDIQVKVMGVLIPPETIQGLLEIVVFKVIILLKRRFLLAFKDKFSLHRGILSNILGGIIVQIRPATFIQYQSQKQKNVAI